MSGGKEPPPVPEVIPEAAPIFQPDPDEVELMDQGSYIPETEYDHKTDFERNFQVPGTQGRVDSSQWEAVAQRPAGRSPLPTPASPVRAVQPSPTPPRSIQAARVAAPPPPAKSSPHPGGLREVSQIGVRREISNSNIGVGFVQKIVAEAEVYIKYGLQDKAIEHLEQVFEHDAYNPDVRLKLKDLYIQMKQYPRAARELFVLAQHILNTDRRRAADLLNEALDLDPENLPVQELLQNIEGSAVSEKLDADFDLEISTGDLTPARESHSAPLPAAQPAHGSDDEDYDVEPGIQDALPPLHLSGQTGWDPQLDHSETADSGDLRAALHPFSELPPYAEEFDEESEEIIVDTGTEFPAVQEAGPALADSDLLARKEPSSVRALEPGGIEDDLEEAEFFMQQSLFSEARAILADLLRRFPGHPLIEAKMAEMELSEQATRSQLAERPPELGRQDLEVRELTTGSRPPAEAGLELLEDMGPARGFSVEDVFREFSRDAESSADEDTDTHFDLGIAFREMQLLDDAITEFTVAMKAPDKEALCRTMIGLCYMDKSDYNEAINEFKLGLKVKGILAHESVALLYELGQAHELMNDHRQALFFYQKVASSVPRFREVVEKITRLRVLVTDDLGHSSSGFN